MLEILRHVGLKAVGLNMQCVIYSAGLVEVSSGSTVISPGVSTG
jgi:hypothetical protein